VNSPAAVQVSLTVAALPKLAVESSALTFQSVVGQNPASQSVSIGCNSPAELNAAIDLLRKHGVQIVSVGQQRNTLEESFLSLIKRESAS